MTCASDLLGLLITTTECSVATMALMQKKTHLIDVFRRILFKIHRPPDFEVGLTIQVGGLDEAHLHTHPSHVKLHYSCNTCSELQPRGTC